MNPAAFLVTTLLLVHDATACVGSSPVAFSAPTAQYSQGGAAPQIAAPYRAAAAAINQVPVVPINSGVRYNSFLGDKVQLADFTSNGYNAEGGGPVSYSSALQCDFEGAPCCWANVPSPEDQIDWQMASGVPETQNFQGVNVRGTYLVAYAVGAAPSDEAQFVSCAIACASSPIRVRANHWQSENVLLQVCQRESFPNSINYNPLLNCQEFPSTQGLGYTELVLPPASLVDIVFVASNFVGENGDMAVLDNIQLDYETDPSKCASPQNRAKIAATGRSNSNFVSEVVDSGVNQELEAQGNSQFRGNGFTLQGSRSAAQGPKTHGSSLKEVGEESVLPLSSASSSSVSVSSEVSSGLNVHKTGTHNPIYVTSEMQACNFTKCNFENETTCSYSDAYRTQSIRGLTTRFQIVKGQFMNRVTGVHEGTEGTYYVATYLYPREVAGLQAEVGFLPENRRLRFQFYEGTHGVQLKGCCDTADNCPFSSDKFVTVSDRTWKYGSYVCPKGTEKFIFLCENTRTNQGACAIDDIQVVENREDISADDLPIC